MATTLLILHGLVAVALLGAITHQTLATWVPAGERPDSVFSRFRAVSPAKFANAVVLLYAVSYVLGGIVFLFFRIDIRPNLERAGHWQALGPDRDPGVRRLVGRSHRSRPEQPGRVRIMTVSPRFGRFAMAYGAGFAVLYPVALKLDLALFTVYPSLGIVLVGTHHAHDSVTGWTVAF